MSPKLSILILTTYKRKKWLDRMEFILDWQIAQLKNKDDVEIIIIIDDGERTIGTKRNEAVERANGIAMAFVDEDDFIGDQYLQRGLDFVNSGKDVASLIGLYFSNGVYDRPFVHSDQYTHWYTEPTRYIRNNNHLNFIKTQIARKIKYEEVNFGEDGRYSEKLKASGLIKTEFEIKEVLYFYFARSKQPGE